MRLVKPMLLVVLLGFTSLIAVQAQDKPIEKSSTPTDIKSLVATMEKDENSVVRMKAAQKLGEMKADIAMPALMSVARTDASSHVRAAATISLGLIGSQKENAGLVPTIMRSFADIHQELETKRFAVWSAARSPKKPPDQPKPTEPSDKPKSAEPFVDDHIYDAMLEAIETIGHPRGKPALGWLTWVAYDPNLNQHTPDTRIRVIRVMGKLAKEDDDYKQSVIQCLNRISSDRNTQQGAVREAADVVLKELSASKR